MQLVEQLVVGMQAQLIERVVPRRLDQTSALFRGASESFVARLMIRMARRPLRAMPGQCIVAQVLLLLLLFANLLFSVRCCDMTAT